ncbi:glycosyltransferase family 2 protein [Chamaesiphon minutus]|uniref:Glycosyl transferase n=1 Tax=Chamaesiphon minutus (strain ATCC 27169 / PCC 6605) TaxID=1173020 RepID=K9UAL2_CHAP6|nr:glycosyltransferase family 2 protein [Chamaesiphon minutus]AFY92152.1 glycosyl transferase [Chamaesiphon minutus PCC 6605]
MMNTSTVERQSNFKGNSQSRLSKRTLWFRYLAEINLIFGAWYLYWRIFHSLDLQALWLAIPLLIAEIYSYIGGAMFTIGLWRPLERQIKSLPDLNPPLPVAEWPTVDVFITCYNEPPQMVEQTARAALAIDYPTTKLRVYILDDGNSMEMRTLAQKLCLEDLQSELLKAQAQRIRSERLELRERLRQIRELMVDTQAADTFVAALPAQSEPNTSVHEVWALPIRFLQVFHQVMTLTHGGHQSVREQLVIQEQELITAIKQKELELTEITRCRYIARPKPEGKAHYAKAGNINYAIFAGDTTGEFMLTLDADHIPKPQILKRVLPYFINYNVWTGRYDSNRIALVQTPQDFYNIPPGDPFGHRAHLFYGPIQQGKDGLNSAFYTGTNAILRREALVSVGLKYFTQAVSKNKDLLNDFTLIGGMSSSSITEDMNTAMRLHGAGWKSVYHHELLAEGLAPDDLASTLQQRLRWAQGTIQVLVQENPWTKPGLSFWQRLQYFQTMYSYFSGFATVILLACPIIFFFTGITPIHTYGSDFIVHFAPAFIVNRLTFVMVTWGIPAREVWRAEQYTIALFPLFIQAVLSVFTKRSIKFKVTPKERQSGIYLNLVMPQLIVSGLTILGILYALVRLAMGTLTEVPLYAVNAGWSLYNLLLLSVIIRAAVWQPKRDR